MNAAPARARYLTAVVHAADGVRFIATAPTSEALAGELAGYVAGRCDDALWPPVAARVRAFIDEGKPQSAIDTYFANVGQRWDAELLEVDPTESIDRSAENMIRRFG